MGKPIRVLLIIPRFHPYWGGTEIRMRRVAEALTERNFRFTVLTRRLSWKLAAHETVGNIDIVRLPSDRLLFRLFAKTWLTRHRSDFDLIHSLRLDKCGPVGAWGQTHLGLPHLAEIITNEPLKMLGRNSGRHALARIVAGSTLVHCLTGETADILAGAGVMRDKLWVRGNAVDISRFRPDGTPPERIVLCCGRIERQKGTDVLLDAWERLPPHDFRLVLAGSGKWEKALRRDAPANVTFAGTVARDAMPALYRSAQIYVQPSRFEGMSNAILEALASGLPIVSTDIPGNDGVIANDVNGLVVPVDDASALTAALARLIADPQLRADMGRASRKAAEDKYSFPALFYAYEETYRSIAAGRTA